MKTALILAVFTIWCVLLCHTHAIKLADTPDEDSSDQESPVPTELPPNAMVGRLEIFSSEEGSTRCMRLSGKIDSSKLTLSQMPCSYNKRFLFIYDPVNSALRPLLVQTHQLSTNANRRRYHEAALVAQFFPSEVMEQRYNDDENNAGVVTLKPRSFSPLKLSNPNSPNSAWCLRASNSERAMAVFAVPFSSWGDSSQCTQVRLVPFEDDFSVGRLLYKQGQSRLCATFNGDVSPPQSVLSLQPCSADQTNQQFLYNDINGQVRAKTDAPITSLKQHPLLFMWWSGAMRKYQEIPLTGDKQNYGWTLPYPHIYGAIFSRDSRGYSGNCWMVENSGAIVANQTCSRFKFDPVKLSLSLQMKEQMRKFYNAAVMLQVKRPADGTQLCLTLFRVLRKLGYGDDSKVSVYKLGLRQCDVRSGQQRFVLVTSDKQCLTKKNCQAHLRWAGDPSNTLLWTLPQQNQSTNLWDQMIQPQSQFEQQIDGWWNLPIREYSSVTVQHGGLSECWSYAREKHVVLGGDECLQVRTVPVQDLFDAPQDVVLVQEFRGSFTTRLTLDVAFTKQFQETSSVNFGNTFFVDSGYSGLRRFVRPRGSDFEHEGDLVMTQGHSISFPFAPNPHLAASDLGMVVFRFAAPKVLSIQGHPGQAFLLFSFQDREGCLVYITPEGHIGLRCATSTQEKDQHCQFRFENGNFLNDGEIHTVSLLYSRSGSHPHTMFVDKQKLGECQIGAWRMTEASSRLRIFYDPANWQYAAYAGRISRVSLYTGSFDSLSNIATGQASVFLRTGRLFRTDTAHPNPAMDSLGFGHHDSPQAVEPTALATGTPAPTNDEVTDQPSMLLQVRQKSVARRQFQKRARLMAGWADSRESLTQEREYWDEKTASLKAKEISTSNDDWDQTQTTSFSVSKLPSITTSWQNCSPLGSASSQYAIQCELHATSPVPLTQDMFNLGCSRPRCQIFFTDQPVAEAGANRFVFEYHPKYPKDFQSESVGEVGMFEDLAWITDGYSRGKASFGIKYTQDNAEPQNALEVEAGMGKSDTYQYKKTEACCATVNSQANDAAPADVTF